MTAVQGNDRGISAVEYQLADLFEALCDANPDAPCVIAGSARRTRVELDRRANQLAHYLEQQGIKPGDHIGIYAHNRVEWLEALLACWKVRAVAVNINFRYVGPELEHIWQDANLVALIYEHGFLSQVALLAGRFPKLRIYLCLHDATSVDDDAAVLGSDYEKALAAQTATRSFAPRSAGDIYLVYTGGTTGMPKGVLWRHEDFYHNVICLNQATENPESILQHANNPNAMRTMMLSPLMHGGGQFSTLITLYTGGVAIIPVTHSLEPATVLRTIAAEGVVMLSLIGDAMARRIAEEKMAGNYHTPSLAIIASGGAILSVEGRALLQQAFGQSIYITGGIGGSEIGSAARETGSYDSLRGPGFTPNALMAVLDEDLNPVLPGSDQVGRLAMRGFIPLGYYNDAEKTARTFLTDKAGVRWVLPGDYARVEADGSFTLAGRGSQCINSGGEKIFVEEVERAVLAHPDVLYCAVVGVADPVWQQRIVAVVECETGRGISLVALQQHCRQLIAGYKIPRELVVTPFKLTDNGKIDYRWAQQVALDASISSPAERIKG
jgi:acyl-CoA synthetase (AMP-forming)/AMP-acid ligase II